MRRILPLSLLLAALALLAGCGWLLEAAERQWGKPVKAEYTGLLGHSVAIVVYVDPATTFEYPQAREEVAAFVTKEFQHNVPDIHLLRYQEVIRWQDETASWDALPVKDIGDHFTVERVLYIEVGQYSTREPGSQDLLRGRLSALAKVYECKTPGDTPAWTQDLDVRWPESAPTDVTRANDLVARKHVLETFSEKLVGSFYDHKEIEKDAHEKD